MMIRTNCGKQKSHYDMYQDYRIDELIDNSIPHVIMTSEGVWNPRVVDGNSNEKIEEMMEKFPPTLK